MSVNQGAAQPAAADAPPSKDKLSRILKFFNVVNGLFLCVAGIVVFMITKVNFAQALAACYVIVFSCLLLCFECHLSCLDAIIYRNFGFMFNWGGRLVFLFLNGVLAFSLEWIGIAAGSFTALVILINTFILCRYRDFGEEYEREFADLRDQAAGKPSQPRYAANDKQLQAVVTASNASSANSQYGGSSGGGAYSGSGMGGALVNAAANNPEAAAAVGSAALSAAQNPRVQSAAADGLGPNPFLDRSSGNSDLTEANGWKKYLDDKSGKYYFYNERTKETKWDTEE